MGQDRNTNTRGKLLEAQIFFLILC
jgi:hypothetical protein